MTMASYNRPPWHRTRTALRVFGQGLLLVVFVTLAYLVTLSAYALLNPIEPETRCFSTAAQGSYCRTQRTWQ